MSRTSFEILAARAGRASVVAHVPHASTVVPDEVRSEFLLNHAELSAELLRLTDWYTDDLFDGLRDHGATMYVNRLSRLVYDPERFLDESAESMAPRGQGVVYWLGSQLQLIREASSDLRAERVDELYRPYHAGLDAVVAERLAAFGGCTVVDCHSFPTTPLRSELDQSPDRPDICIGTDAAHTPSELTEAMVATFAAEGFRIGRDTPFAGTFVPSGYYGRDRRVRSVMIEVRRGLYMDEATAARRPDYDTIRDSVTRAVTAGLGLAPKGE